MAVVEVVVVWEVVEEESWMEMGQMLMLCLHSGRLCLA